MACQRRTGSPIGLMAYYAADQLTIVGDAQRYERPIVEGNTFETFFYSTCGSTIYARAGKHPTMIGVAVGTIADPEFQPPVRSVWEQTMHRWITMPGDAQHFPKGRG
ncbi:GFA family protein [uncultured Sphingomonas sp.]|uniref:GFA family protein n=1 Tax=uncultured Sphingomonas sp. TaxID=158754 RepID=UPI0025E28F88|nr:GFA family protein [uncultured Sphingomonas sp.]